MGTRKPTHASRLQTMSIPELADGMVMVRLRLNRAGVKHRGRKLKDGPLLNAVVAWYLAQPVGEQDRIAREGLRLFEAMLGDRAGDDAPSAPAPGPGGSPKASPMDVADLSDLGRKRQADRKHEMK